MNELMKEFENAVNLLAQAMAKEGAKMVVKRLDEEREHVADAARALYLKHGYHASWLDTHGATEIIGACVSANRNHGVCVGLIEGGMRCIGCGPSYSLWEPIYPNRELTADSARYLWENQVSGDLGSMLRRETISYILDVAAGRQVNLCKKVADDAWIAFDEGGYRVRLRVASSDRITELAGKAKAAEVRKKPRELLGVLNIEGYGEHGQRVKVEGVPVLERFVLDLESEFIKRSAKAYGIAAVTNASFSSGPGIYY